MKDDFMYVLENYPNADLSNKKDREKIAIALSNIMCEHHIVSYTDLDAVKNDPKMTTWINHCKTIVSSDDEDVIERGL
tara:strand:+ start:284 stop:517 length:234 start_codon:yes stop_codon:yes gene_type:complete